MRLVGFYLFSSGGMMERCDWERLPDLETDGPMYRCRECRVVLDIRRPNPEEVLAQEPACGVRMAEQQRRLAAIMQARKEALAAGRPFPPLVKRVGSWAKAVARWAAAGKPCRSDEEVQRIFDTLCQPCEHFRVKKQSCNLCGCKVRRDGAAFKNKIRMATEQCALVPPKWGGGDSSMSR